MKKVLITAAIILALSIFIIYSSIVHIQGTEKLPGIDIRQDKINKDFIVYEDPVIGTTNSHKNGDLLLLSVKNQGITPIHFLPGYIKIYTKIDNNWSQIINNMSNPEIEEVLPTTTDYPSGRIEFIIPSIQNMLYPTVIRVFLIGQLEDSGEKIGAYVDIELVP